MGKRKYIYHSHASKEQNGMILLENSYNQYSCAASYLWSKSEFHLPTALQSSTFHSICFKKRTCLPSSQKCLYFKKGKHYSMLQKKNPYFLYKWKHSSLCCFI